MKLKRYHFSATFEGSDIKYHGEFLTAYTDIETIKQYARKALVDKLSHWLMSVDDLTVFEIYTEEREIIFTYKKHIKNEIHPIQTTRGCYKPTKG